MVLLISYDLNGHERPAAYARVKKLIETGAGAGNFVKPLYSQWLVDTQGTATTWREYLQQTGGIDSNDRLLVTEVTRNWDGWLDQTVIDWVAARVK